MDEDTDSTGGELPDEGGGPNGSSENPNGAQGADDEAESEDDGSSAVDDFGFRIGIPLALIAVAWAFVGPAHLVETGRFEWPIVASLAEPVQPAFFAFVGGVVFLFGFLGSLVFPSTTDEDQEGYASDLAINLLVPTIGVVILMVVLGYLVPAVHYLLNGALLDAGLILVGIVVVVAIALAFETIAALAVMAASAPLWVPSFAGAYSGSFLRQLIS